MIHDRTCRGRPLVPGLSHAWWLGGHLYRALGRFDAWTGVASWAEALDFLRTAAPGRPIAEVQYWGHGKWGNARVGCEPLDARALAREHELAPALRDVAARMLPGAEGLWWFRTCETFGARAGHAFARDLADFLGCRVAGHTYVIGHVQSGLHSLMPGADPSWPDDEALREGTPDEPTRAHWSRWGAPNTITCLRGSIPRGF
jgi:hypothetical protein